MGASGRVVGPQLAPFFQIHRGALAGRNWDMFDEAVGVPVMLPGAYASGLGEQKSLWRC